MRAPWRARILPALLGLAGLAILLYGPAAQWFEQKNQADATAALDGTVERIGQDAREVLRAEASRYNEALLTGVGLDDFTYTELLNPGGVGLMARLRIPSIDLDQPVRHGMSEEVLRQGLGHLEHTSLPVGGTSTHAVIGGHRGLAEATGFTYLPDIQIGDEVYLEVLGEVLTYRVVSTQVLDPGTAEVQPIEPGVDILTLVTCTPLGLNTDRFVARAERVEGAVGDQAAGIRSELPRFPWWVLGAAGGLAACSAYVAWPTRRSGTRKVG